MAVKSMRFQSNLKVPDETKTGYVIWDGNAQCMGDEPNCGRTIPWNRDEGEEEEDEEA